MAKRILQLVITLLIFSSCSSTGEQSDNEKKAMIYYQNGTIKLQEGQYTDALAKLMRAYELDNDNPKIINNLAMAYYFKGEKKTATHFLKKALEENPNNSDARNNLASIYLQQNQLALAKRHLEMIRKDLLYKGQHQVLYNLALIDIKQGNLHTALENLRLSTSERETYCPSFYQMGLIYKKRNQMKQALQAFIDATQGTCIKNPAPLMQTASIYESLGQYELAKEQYDLVIKNAPGSKYVKQAKRKSVSLTGRQPVYRSKIDEMKAQLGKEKKNKVQ